MRGDRGTAAQSEHRSDYLGAGPGGEHGVGELAPAVIPPRIRVTLTRICLGGLDSDNLQGAFKYVRDEVARWLGRDDGDPSYEWVYEHRPAKRGVHHVELRIEARS